jgi:uracil-DNA glycosylase family 4
MTRDQNPPAVIDEIRDYLVFLKKLGITGFDASEKAFATLKEWEHPIQKIPGDLIAIRSGLVNCRRCKLHGTRKNIVFGTGDSHAKLVFIGEGPGVEEDETGEPFVGPAGILLTRIIEAMGLTRDRVYICNIVKCRPPHNRNPEPDEVAACVPFLKQQIDAVKPGFICALGSVAARTLLKSDLPISKLRGRFYDFNGIRLLPTYHPSYLLRNPDKKRDVWEDMKLLMKAMGIEPPAR